MKTIYEHAGSKISDSCYNVNVTDCMAITRNKPTGGLWASRATNNPNNAYTWKEWCVDERYDVELYMSGSEYFSLSDNAKILRINGNNGINLSDFYKSINYCSIDKKIDKEDYIKQVPSAIFESLLEESERKHLYDIFLCDNNNEYLYALNLNYIKDNYDGIEVIFGENYGYLYGNGFNCYSCDSICIWNRNVVEIIPEEQLPVEVIEERRDFLMRVNQIISIDNSYDEDLDNIYGGLHNYDWIDEETENNAIDKNQDNDEEDIEI